MSPAADPDARGDPHAHGDHHAGGTTTPTPPVSLGRAGASRRTAHSGDDGSADPRLLAALLAFREGKGDQVEIVEAYREARLLIPLVAEKGDQGVGAHGLVVDKTQELVDRHRRRTRRTPCAARVHVGRRR